MMHDYAFERSAGRLRCWVPAPLSLLGARSTQRGASQHDVSIGRFA
jgi:hypothetical protein